MKSINKQTPSQIKIGSIIAYLNLFLHLIISVFLTPFIISHLGQSEYGVYKIVQSFSAQLGIMSFGISTLVARNIVYFNEKKETKDKENFLFLAYLLNGILAFFVVAVGFVMFLFIDTLYGKSLSASELSLAKKLFIVLVFNVAITISCETFTGLIRSKEKFIVSNTLTFLRLVLRLSLLFILLSIGLNSVAIVLTDLGVSLLFLLLSFLYSKIKIKEKAKFHYFDKGLIRSTIIFSSAMLLQSIVAQVNNNVDNIILGSMKGSVVVSVYSVGLSLYGIFASVVDVFRGMFGPRATKLVARGAGPDELTMFAIKPARIQTMIAFLGEIGFILLGKEFISAWLGEGFEDVYKITLILIIPAFVPMVESISYEILDAKMKRMGRSIILLFMCGINIGLTILFVYLFGYVGAAYATAISLLIGDWILTNIYIHKSTGLKIFTLFKGALSKTWIAALFTIYLGYIIVNKIPLHGWIGFIVEGILIVAVYCLFLYFIGLKKEEKKYVDDSINRIKNKITRLFRR